MNGWALHTQPDAIVIGGGPSGSSAAYELASAGWHVLVADRRKEIGKPVQCAEFVHRAGYKGPESAISQPIQKMVTHLPNGQVFYSDSPGYVIHRDRYDEFLAQKAQKAGAIYAMKTHAQCLENGATFLKNGSQKNLTSRLVIDASGPKHTLQVARAIQMRVPLGKPIQDIHVWLREDIIGGYAWLFPKQNEANLGLAVTMPAQTVNLNELLFRVFNDIKSEFQLGETPISYFSGLIPVSGLTSLRRENMLFVGDACGITHPVSGEGIYRATLTGELAGKVGADFLSSNDETVLDEYPEQVLDIFEHANQRDSQKRQLFESLISSPAPIKPEAYRKIWIGFQEYYQN